MSNEVWDAVDEYEGSLKKARKIAHAAHLSDNGMHYGRDECTD